MAPTPLLGPIPPFNPHIPACKGSLYLTRPVLADDIADPAEKAELASEIFGHIAADRIPIETNQRYVRELEARKTPAHPFLLFETLWDRSSALSPTEQLWGQIFSSVPN